MKKKQEEKAPKISTFDTKKWKGSVLSPRGKSPGRNKIREEKKEKKVKFDRSQPKKSSSPTNQVSVMKFNDPSTSPSEENPNEADPFPYPATIQLDPTLLNFAETGGGWATKRFSSLTQAKQRDNQRDS